MRAFRSHASQSSDTDCTFPAVAELHYPQLVAAHIQHGNLASRYGRTIFNVSIRLAGFHSDAGVTKHYTAVLTHQGLDNLLQVEGLMIVPAPGTLQEAFGGLYFLVTAGLKDQFESEGDMVDV